MKLQDIVIVINCNTRLREVFFASVTIVAEREDMIILRKGVSFGSLENFDFIKLFQSGSRYPVILMGKFGSSKHGYCTWFACEEARQVLVVGGAGFEFTTKTQEVIGGPLRIFRAIKSLLIPKGSNFEWLKTHLNLNRATNRAAVEGINNLVNVSSIAICSEGDLLNENSFKITSNWDYSDVVFPKEHRKDIFTLRNILQKYLMISLKENFDYKIEGIHTLMDPLSVIYGFMESVCLYLDSEDDLEVDYGNRFDLQICMKNLYRSSLELKKLFGEELLRIYTVDLRKQGYCLFFSKETIYIKKPNGAIGASFLVDPRYNDRKSHIALNFIISLVEHTIRISNNVLELRWLSNSKVWNYEIVNLTYFRYIEVECRKFLQKLGIEIPDNAELTICTTDDKLQTKLFGKDAELKEFFQTHKNYGDELIWDFSKKIESVEIKFSDFKGGQRTIRYDQQWSIVED